MDKIKLYTEENLGKLRLGGDELADAAVISILENPGFSATINNWVSFPKIEQLEGFPKPLKSYFEFFLTPIDWIDQVEVLKVHDFFAKEGNFYLSMLGFYSLPYCYAFADGAQVLIRSMRITEEIGMRLAETTLFVMDLFSPDNFHLHQDAQLSIAKVRLIHAFSRCFVKLHSKDWNTAWGLPINQEDMIGTNLAFSLMVIRGLEKINKFPGKDTLEAVLHYWKIVGYFMGINIDYWPNTSKEAFELEKLIRKRHLRSSEAGQNLVKALIQFYEDTIPDQNISTLSETLISYFIGKEASDALAIRERVAIPKSFYGLMLELSFLKQSGRRPSYAQLRSQFLSQTEANLGKKVKLSIPDLNRS
ncbi:hypothetical protein SAMN06295967_10456 [Belliella buryatensis]|uniref:ER-bound oxygenase mpaB/mpaB'/Rubber oxygenase catalytic domain-containing protein n=1 Tax=Belliella buryatensis TaxID=1500549 RepID=A0A239C3A5_9BACT|nr:oxygenase MpaB family protein [Belliella buryatensis]SNS14620.1 hypothetical protein SAMN06295967_10456 [Belliella buryatensis]